MVESVNYEMQNNDQVGNVLLFLISSTSTPH